MKKLPPFHTLDRKEFSTLSNKIYDILNIQFQNDTNIWYDDSVIARGMKIVLNFISSYYLNQYSIVDYSYLVF